MNLQGPLARCVSLILTTLSLVSFGYSQKCEQEKNCKLPDCFCPTYIHPLGKANIPQIVYFGFDDAVQTQVSSYYDQLFKDRKNPNGCPITMTLYISNSSTQYDLVASYYQKGDEMAVHSVTHTDIDTEAKLRKEASEQKRNIETLANVPARKIVGWRSPNLKTAGDAQPKVLKELGFTYDISLPYSRDTNYPFPFTLDYGYPYPCNVAPCPDPNSSHTGFWEVMIHSYTDPVTGYPCGYVDSCRPESEDDALEFLWSNFLTTYENEKAPFGLNMHAAWFAFPGYLDAMERFVDRLLRLEDVYIVNVDQMIEWMKNPTDLAGIKSFAPWGCVLRGNHLEHRPGRAVPTRRPPVQYRPLKYAVSSKTGTTTSQTPILPTMYHTPTTQEDSIQETQKHNTKQQQTNWFSNYLSNIRSKRLNFIPTYKPTEQTSITTTSKKQQPAPATIFYRAINETSQITKEPDTCIQGENCRLPKCFCKITQPPNGPPAKLSPQIVYLIIDSHIDGRTYGPLTQILGKQRINPNGCHVSSSIFVPLKGNYPPYVTTLSSMGAKIGVLLQNSSIKDNGVEFFIRELEQFELNQRDLFGVHDTGVNIHYLKEIAKILGTKDGSTNQFIVSESYEKVWPHTLNSGQLESINGLWEVPLTTLQRPGTSTGGCWHPDSCPLQISDMDTFQMLKYNFDNRYFRERLPLGIVINENWLVSKNALARIRGLNIFLDYVLTKPDVMVASVDKMLQWIISTGQYGHSFSC